MATVKWTMKAQAEKRQLYLDGRLIFGARIAKKTAQKIERIQKSLERFPSMGHREPLLEELSPIYRTCIINKRFKIIYWYSEADDIVVIEDIWDTHRAPQNLRKRINN